MIIFKMSCYVVDINLIELYLYNTFSSHFPVSSHGISARIDINKKMCFGKQNNDRLFVYVLIDMIW